MRTKPHSTFWAWAYSVLYFLQSGWPGWAGAAAAAVFFLLAGRAASPDDAGTVYRIGLAVFLVCVGLLLFGGQRIEKMLEVLNWIMIIGILGSLLVLGSLTGYIPTLLAGRRVKLAHTGTAFEPGPESLAHWRGWWRIVRIDQWGIFFVGALLGMGLPGLLYMTAIPAGTDMRGLNVSSELARGLAVRGGTWIPMAVAVMTVWILFKAQVDIMEGMVRSITDILWSGSHRIRAWRGGDVRVVYYTVLALLLGWGLFAMGLTEPIILLQLGANVAGLVMVVGALHILRINTTLLPQPLRPTYWRRAALVLMALFYGFFVCLSLLGRVV